MTNSLRSISAAAGVILAATMLTVEANADWEQVRQLPTTYSHFITSEGVHLMSDYRSDYQGGIYYSEDKGETWTKTSVRDYTFSHFYEADGYVFALGSACRIARSEDGGRTWDLLNYRKAVEEYLGTNADYTVCYAITVSDGVLYIGDFLGGGVLRSDDYGETWSSTDRSSLQINLQGELIVENFYHLETFQGYVYAFGIYTVHAYDAELDKWYTLPVNSNFMGSVTVMNDKMICGRGSANYDYDSDFLYVVDGNQWDVIPRPDTPDNNVRAIGNDGERLYVMMAGGPMYFTTDLGEHWACADGLPSGYYPLTIATDDDYVYTALYHESETDRFSGLWRIAKTDLDALASVTAVEADPTSVSITATELEVELNGALAENISVYDIAGQCVAHSVASNRVDISSLSAGAYIYRVVCGGAITAGKFVK